MGTVIEHIRAAKAASFRNNPLVIMRAAVADRWFPKYRDAVRELMQSQVDEVAEQIRQTGGTFRISTSMKTRWFLALVDLKTKYVVPMIAAGYDLATQEFGEKAFKAQDVEIPTDPNEFLQRHNTQDVQAWIEESATSETATMSKEIDNIMAEADVFRDPATGRGLTPREIAKKLVTEGAAKSKARANMLARTTVIWSYNQGAKQRYADIGVTTIEWFATADDMLCEFCEEMDGQTVTITSDFLPGGSTLTGSEGGELNVPFAVGHPPVHPNCRCAIIPVL